ncbi:hypothetical protein CONLIGDRAFT_679359 [Coniochaeta ligniaria NRRL 30616]|uniref:2EXR domain-containing protein n=1 Tax=Coniochaeta ligniaria NRRL 30616 TaxID=1408157 RepID=A0A1J7JS37_9PEZI|nr:hypothetical protein CONLIGDRAFT_679359 [Coniochaeta ligniaria NRRL 30616]
MPQTTRAPVEAAGGCCFLLNDELIKNTEPTLHQFHPFLRLPTELRMKIWKFTLPRQRWLPLVLERCEHPGPDPSSAYSLSLGSKSQASNTLLHVKDKAAEDVFDRHYRVKLPLKPLESGEENFLCLCPEDDIVHILEVRDGNIFAAFLHDVLTADEKGVGLGKSVECIST